MKNWIDSARQRLLECPCECKIESPGSISHGVSLSISCLPLHFGKAKLSYLCTSRVFEYNVYLLQYLLFLGPPNTENDTHCAEKLMFLHSEVVSNQYISIAFFLHYCHFCMHLHCIFEVRIIPSISFHLVYSAWKTLFTRYFCNLI